MDGIGFGNIGALSSLLAECKEKEDETHSVRQSQPPIAGGSTVVRTSASSAGVRKAVDSKSIWDVTEVPSEDSIIATAGDSRKCPKYEICYKQAVGTEDTFLGLSDKTPSSEDCTHLVVKIHFPGSKMKDLDLDVTKNRIKAESATLRLFTYLPQAVDHENGNAKFDAKRELLIVTLPIIDDE